MASSDLIKWATSNGKLLKHYASAFLALFSITSLLGCDMFQEKIFQPLPEPPIITKLLVVNAIHIALLWSARTGRIRIAIDISLRWSERK